jgi:hypothetical protein
MLLILRDCQGETAAGGEGLDVMTLEEAALRAPADPAAAEKAVDGNSPAVVSAGRRRRTRRAEPAEPSLAGPNVAEPNLAEPNLAEPNLAEPRRTP